MNKYHITKNFSGKGYRLYSNNPKIRILINSIKDNLIYLLPENLFFEYIVNDKFISEKYKISKNKTITKKKRDKIKQIFETKVPQNDQNIKKLNYICRILIKNNIFYIQTQECNLDLLPFSEFFEQRQENSFLENVYNFDYIGLKNLINNQYYKLDKNIDINVFSKAYAYYKLLEYDKAYNELKNISQKHKENYFIYSISEFNKKELESLISFKANNYPNIDKNNYKNIREEINQIDIQKIFEEYSFLPYKRLLENKLNFSYLNKIAASINQQIIDVQKTKDNVERGGLSLNSAINDLFINVFDIFEYITFNFLLIEHNEQVLTLYYLFIDTILKSYSIQENEEFGCSKVESFDYFLFYIMIEYLKPEDFLNIIARYKIHNLTIAQNEEGVREELIKNFEKLCSSMQVLNLNDEYFWNKLNNFLIIFANINLSKDENKKIIINLIELHSNIGCKTNRNCQSKLFVYLNYYLNRKFNNKKDIIDFNVLSKFLNHILLYYKNYSDINLQRLDLYSLIHTIVYIFEQYNYDFQLDDKSIIDNLFDSYDSTNLNNEDINKWINIVTFLFKFLNKDLQKKIKIVFNKFFQSYFSFDLYYNACFHDIIKSNSLLEQEALKIIKNKIEQLKQEPHCINYKNELRFLFGAYTSLIVRSKVRDIKNLKPFNTFGSEIFDFIVDMKNFDYKNKFNFEFIIGLPQKYLLNIKKLVEKDINIKNIIQDAFFKYIATNSPNNCNEIYSKYKYLFEE